MKKRSKWPSESEDGRRCDYEDCLLEGAFKAPKSPRNDREYYWFCLSHVREYNLKWDYYRGMSSDEIDASRKDDVTWNRPSWPLGPHRSYQFLDENLDHLFSKPAPSPALPPSVVQALSVMDLSLPLEGDHLKASYKKLVKAHHPDKFGGDQKKTEHLQKINEAYKTLKQFIEAPWKS